MDKELWDWLSNNEHLSEEELQIELEKRFSTLSDAHRIQGCDSAKIGEVQTWWNELQHTNHGLFYELISDYSNQFPENKELIGSDFGAYTLIELIGEGGMGRVFSAERNDGVFERKVAIKLMKFNISKEQLAKRFEQEQRILASLNHASIAQLFDATISDKGIPYFVMEWVEGSPVTTFIEASQLSIKDRLKLFVQICNGVEHAHKNLIIHKDLKPSNILIDGNGDPKILDFGISDFIKDSSESELNHPYTLAYASPEIIKNERINTSTDVFSLGMILTESLIGDQLHNNVGSSKNERLANLENDTHIKITSNKAPNSIERDLEAIIKKATSSSQEERYSTVADLKQDVERVLQNRPISLFKEQKMYTTKKWITRNTPLATLSLLTVLLCVIFGAVYVTQISKERSVALEEAKKAKVTKDYLLGLFEMADPLNKPGEEQTVRSFLNKGIQNLNELDSEPETKEEASYTLAQVAFNLGEYVVSDSLYQVSSSLNEKLSGAGTARQANILDWRTDVKIQQGEFRPAKQLVNASLAIKRKIFKETDSEMGIGFSQLGIIYARLEKLDSAEIFLEKAKQISLKYPDTDKKNSIVSLEASATLSREQGDFERSIRLMNMLIEILVDDPEGKDRQLATAYNNLGFSYRQMEGYEMAIQSYDSSLQILERVFGKAHPNTITVMGNLAGSYALAGDLEAAEHLYLERLENIKSHYGDVHWRTGQAYSGLGGIYIKIKDWEKAKESHQSSIRIYSKALGSQHFWTNRARLYYYSLSNDLDSNRLFSETIEAIKSSLNQPLSYYDYGSLEQMKESFKANNRTELASELSQFLDWYNVEFVS